MKRMQVYGMNLAVALACVGMAAPAWSAPTISGDPVVAVSHSPDGLWTRLSSVPSEQIARTEWIRPHTGVVARLEQAAVRAALEEAPLEFTQAASDRPAILDVPMPEGGYEAFAVVETHVMHPELAAQFPQIRTYVGQGIDDPSASVRITMTHKGFDAQVMGPNGWYYIDRYSADDDTLYTSFRRAGLDPRQNAFVCSAHARDDGGFQAAVGGVEQQGGNDDSLQRAESDAATEGTTTLRTYRLAVATTGEFTQFFGGSVADGLSGVVTAVNRMTGIYEIDTRVRFQLVPNNNLIIETSPGGDPWPSGGPSSLGSVDSYIDSRIGSSNYDIGHLVDTGGGGFAFLGVACTSSRGGGYTGLTPPTGDVFWVDYFSHEVGHQFGANHSFNGVSGSCSGFNRNGSTAYEPGSGNTIMGYAGICGSDNVQPNSDPVFHWISINEITNYTRSGSGNSCPTTTVLNNSDPVVDAGPSYTIPVRTPFELTATVSDPDGDEVTVSWEQADRGPARSLGSADNGSSPLFRTFDPVSSPSRMFPRLSSVLNGTDNASERYPNTNRTMNFRAVVRDNRAGGGGLAMDSTQVTSRTSAGPFEVTSQSSPTMFTGGDTFTVTWDVANTTASPINAATVSILWSDDNGQSFDTVLVSGTPNDGSEKVQAPIGDTTDGRIRVQADGNIFFNINGAKITVEGGSSPCLADVNMNGEVEPTDFGAWLAAFNAGDPIADQNQNGQVEPTDFGAWLANFNAGCP